MRAAMLGLLLAAGALACAPAIPAATIHVPGDQSTIQAGIDAAAPGDTVLVAAGTYTGDGNRDLDFSGKDLVLKSEAGADATILDAGASEQEPHRILYLHSGETPAARIDGFTIRGGLATEGSAGDYTGGGLYCRAATPTIVNCVFADNMAFCGGAVWCNGSMTFTDCSFVSNSAEQGGAIQCAGGTTFTRCTFTSNGAGIAGAIDSYCDVVVVDCEFQQNWCINDGGAIRTQGGAPTISGSRFESNGASPSGGGGAIFFDGGSPLVEHCEFARNCGGWWGGAMVFARSSATVADCMFLENWTGGWGDGVGGAVLCAGPSSDVFTACRFEGNKARAYYPYSGKGVGGAIMCSQRADAELVGCLLKKNSAGGWFEPGLGGGLAAFGGSNPRCIECVFWNNTAESNGDLGFGGAVACDGSSPSFVRCSFHTNSCTGEGSSFYATGPSLPTLDNSIVAFGLSGGTVLCVAGSAMAVSCSDIYGNAGGDWIGCIADQFGMNGNISADPLFCDAEAGDFHLDCHSPCAPTQQPECGLIGAWGVACGASATRSSTWGLVKHLFEMPGR